MFFADAVKCFDKILLKDSLLEVYNSGYDSNTLKILSKMNKETDIIIRTPVGNRKYTGQRNGRTGHDIWTHYLLCRDIHS